MIALLKHHPRVSGRIQEEASQELCLSSLVAHELFSGAYRAVRTERAIAQFESLPFQVLDLTLRDAKRAGAVRAALAAIGRPIGPYDVLIAGQTLQRGLTLVTRDVRGFARVPGLAVENWEDDTR